jgi:hypothetical protein
MVTKFGTLLASANFENEYHYHNGIENEYHYHNGLRTKNDRKKVYLPMGDTLTHGICKAVLQHLCC